MARLQNIAGFDGDVWRNRGNLISIGRAPRNTPKPCTEPPYDAMIDYSDASDLFYVWIKRALAGSWPEICFTAHELGVQEKQEEIIVKKGGTSNNDHRNRQHYDTLITKAFAEAQRVVVEDGIVTIVFGHGEPEVWQRLLTAIRDAGLVLTGAWPAKTEPGGKVGFTNIVTTLTMTCPGPRRRDARLGARAPWKPNSKLRSGAGIRTGSAGVSRRRTC